jgi:GNAT superfamily N-acetyltransferase
MTTTGTTIRRATPDDAEAIWVVHRSSILNLGRAYYSAEEVESWAHGLTPDGDAKAMTEGGETMEIAVAADGRTVAFCSWRDDEVLAVYVHPDGARQGIATRLLARAEAAIAENGHGRIRISASLAGRGFYEKRGYRVVARADWQTRGGLVVETFDMVKDLDGPPAARV